MLMSNKNHPGEAKCVILVKIMQRIFYPVEFIVGLIIMLFRGKVDFYTQ